MKQLIPVLSAAIITALPLHTSGGQTPKGWLPAGSHPNEYQMTLDRSVTHEGKASASLKSIKPQTSGFGTLMQTCSADSFRGQRVRLAGYVRAQEVGDWAGLWMRVDGSKGQPLAFDNMQDRPVKGTSDWRKYEIVLDVAEDAKEIAFGLLLSGKGQVWMDDLKFETVGKDVATTGNQPTKRTPKQPKNLDFEK